MYGLRTPSPPTGDPCPGVGPDRPLTTHHRLRSLRLGRTVAVRYTITGSGGRTSSSVGDVFTRPDPRVELECPSGPDRPSTPVMENFRLAGGEIPRPRGRGGPVERKTSGTRISLRSLPSRNPTPGPLLLNPLSNLDVRLIDPNGG